MDYELNQFKGIDLRHYLLSAGYEIDPRKSTRRQTHMRCGGDRLGVTLKPNGEWVWFSFSGDGGKGSILDFLEQREGITNVGEWRKRLRPWIGRDDPSPLPAPVPCAAKDVAAVRAEFLSMAVARSHPYLEIERAIPAAVLASTRFAGRVRINKHGNAVFPHYDRTGICGFELRGRKFKGFSPAGTKGLWCSHVRAEDNVLALFESAIDGMSYSILFRDPQTRYVSTAGEVSGAQQELIGAAIERMPIGSEIVSAMDADPGGREHTKRIRGIFDLVARKDLRFREHFPETEKADWNDVLRKAKPE
jgi:hypothetical protein